MRIYNNNNQVLQNAIAAIIQKQAELESKLKIYKTSFTQGDINIADAYVAIHNLNTASASVSVFDETGEHINPREITITDSNTITIDLSDYTPINGTYSLLIYG